MAEIRIFGSSVAELRLIQLLRIQLPDYDLQEIICHYFEELIWRNANPSKELLAQIPKSVTQDSMSAFKSAVLSHFSFNAKNEELDCPDLFDEVRRLALAIKLNTDVTYQRETKSQLLLLLQGISKENSVSF